MISRLLDRFADWAVSRNPGGPYKGSDDHRWAWVVETDGSKYMTRISLPFRIFGIKLVLNRFHRQDLERHLHNHPWKWALSIVLTGSYEETRLLSDAFDACCLYDVALGEGVFYPEDFTHSRHVKKVNLLLDADYHRVDKLHGDVWTLFVTGPGIGDWGFLVKGKHVSWRDYLKRSIEKL